MKGTVVLLIRYEFFGVPVNQLTSMRLPEDKNDKSLEFIVSL